MHQAVILQLSPRDFGPGPQRAEGLGIEIAADNLDLGSALAEA